MVELVASVPLPVMEELLIKKNRLTGGSGTAGKRISIVTGIHGDELEGQYICFELNRRVMAHPDYLNGVLDIYPAMNPLGIDSITRGFPGFDLDMNRIFPGNLEGTMAETLAAMIIDDVSGSDLAIDLHASNIFLTEVPQVRINTLHRNQLVPIAEKLNVDLIWVHANSTVLESTFAFSLNSRGTPTLVVEAGVGMRITKCYCTQIVEGILSVMSDMGVWTGPVTEPREPYICDRDEAVIFLNAPEAGVFISSARQGDMLKKGDEVGMIVNPLDGEIFESIKAPADGLLFTIREYPVVNEGSLMGRMLRMEGLS